MSQQPQEKNEDTTDEQNEKDPEELQKPSLKEEKLQKPPLKEQKLKEAAPAETAEKVKLPKKRSNTHLNI